MNFNDVINSKQNCIIFGKNNAGKSLFLRELNSHILKNNIEFCFNKKNDKLKKVYFIPAIRLDQNTCSNESFKINISEQFFEYFLRLNQAKGNVDFIYTIRNIVLNNKDNENIILNALEFIFGEKFDLSNTLSDGVENVINILTNIMFMIKTYSDINNKKCLIIIDEIEIYLHVSSQLKLLEYFEKNFKNCKFILSTHSTVLLQRLNNYSIYEVINKNNSFNLVKLDEDIYYKKLDIINAALTGIEQYPNEVTQLLKLMLIPNHKLSLKQVEKIIKLNNIINYKYPNLNFKISNEKIEFCNDFINEK